MSFLFKSKQRTGTPSGLPAASRDLRSAEGSHAVTGPPSSGTSKTTPQGSESRSLNNSLNSISSQERVARSQPGSTELTPQQQQQQQQQIQQQTQPPSQQQQQQPQRDLMSENNRQLVNGQSTSPEQKTLRDRSADAYGQRIPAPMRGPPLTQPPADPFPYPWSQRRLNFTVSHNTPFPRYGAAVNATASKDGSIYLMGGLINGSTVKGDLWMVEALGGQGGPSQLTCFPVATTSEGPGPRVGHASLLVGNAFIVFGGDTKMDEGDVLDDTLYLLNTSTQQWSRALPAGPRPPGRYGHSLNILGSKIYIFGGQVEGYFFNDLVAFDLNALQQPTNRWEILIHNTIDGGPPHGQIPPARTNHTMVSWQDRLYLFGGTDGVHWFNDVWCYNPHTNSWAQLDCIGYIPSPREGHAAALVGDVMYIFGGRTEEGNDLGDLAAFRISTRRWYTFQNMGPSPSPRSGHSMTTVGKQIIVLAGEPSSAPRDPIELGLAYCLDTNKIKYPPDNTSQPSQANRRPSTERTNPAAILASQARNATASPQQSRASSAAGDYRTHGETASRLPRPGQQPTQPPAPLQQSQVRPNGVAGTRQPTGPDRALSPSGDTERAQQFERRAMGGPAYAPVPETSTPSGSKDLGTRTPASPPRDGQLDDQGQTRQKPETYQPSQDSAADAAAGLGRKTSRGTLRNAQDVDRHEGASTPSREIEGVRSEQRSKVRDLQRDDGEFPQDSGIGSSPATNSQHYDEIARELDQARRTNAWFASELALAKKSGYHSRNTPDSPPLDANAIEAFSDDDKPLIEALLKMRAELVRVQDTINEQAKNAAAKIAEVEKQRNVAINEAVFAKAKLAGQAPSPLPDADKSAPSADGSRDRGQDLNRRLAISLAAQADMSTRLDSFNREVESEKKARKLAEAAADAAQKRVLELDSHRQHSAGESEGLRSELHMVHMQARDAMASHQELLSKYQLLELDNKDMRGRLDSTLAANRSHDSVLLSLREAVESSARKSQLLERQLDDERSQREALDLEFGQLAAEHEQRKSALNVASSRVRDLEQLAQSHAEEARTHRVAVLAGLGSIADRPTDSVAAADERVVLLQQQIEAANTLVRQNQKAADNAGEKLRRAEERIAGLEAYQEQSSREGLSIRKQLQAAHSTLQAVHSEKSELEQKLQSQMLDANAIAVQHGALKDILHERGINPSEIRRSRIMDSPSSIRLSTPDLRRVQELEQQLESSMRNHEEMKAQFDEVSERDDRMKREYEDKLTALDNDHQAAVKYLRGTEKMLSKMKQELQRVKNENADLRKKIEKAGGHVEAEEASGSACASPVPPSGWESEREKLKKEAEQSQAALHSSVSELENKIATIQGRLQATETDLADSRTKHENSNKALESLQQQHSQGREAFDRLRQENAVLEERARDAESKVQLLLDQVETSVDNYRRQSRTDAATPMMNGSALHDHAGSPGSNAEGSVTSEHYRSASDGLDSTTSNESNSVQGPVRNSLALDSLATELDALRTHWETTNRNYRLSDRFEFERTPTNSTVPNADGNNGMFGSLASWRSHLDIGDEEEGDKAVSPSISDSGQQTPTTATHPGVNRMETSDTVTNMVRGTPGGLI